MFIAAGALVIGGVVGVIAHSDYSDYYADYAERERKRQQASLKAKENELLKLKSELENECNETYETIRSELDSLEINIEVNERDYFINSKTEQNCLKKEIEKKLIQSLSEDRKALEEINIALKKINKIQLMTKKNIINK